MEESGAIVTSEQLNEVVYGLSGSETEEVTRKTLASMVTSTMSKEQFEWIVQCNLQCPRSLAATLLYNQFHTDWRDRIAKIRKLTLIVAGRKVLSPGNRKSGSIKAFLINITTALLSVTNGAQLGASSSGNGAADNITIEAESIRLDNGTLNSNTTGDRGNITLQTGDLILRRGSSITTNAEGTNVSGGNITIDAGVLAALENSDITANSTDFQGGNVRVNARGIFGTEFREALTPESDITATGAISNGIVQLDTPNTDLNRGLAVLPANVIDSSELIANSCIGRGNRQQGSFIITGNGGLPLTPDDPLDQAGENK